MEELRDINFQALIEGQDNEKALQKIVSIIFHCRMCTYSQLMEVCIWMLEMSMTFLNPRSCQGFSSFHYTPLEVLLVIEQCQKRLQRVFTPEEIESGILKGLLIESDYDIITAVSTYLLKVFKMYGKLVFNKTCLFYTCVYLLMAKVQMLSLSSRCQS